MRPYDLVCRRGDDEVHVEVNGLSGPPARIVLTANEVQHARSCRHAALAVVAGIRGDSSGRLRLADPWQIDRHRLLPTQYSYSLT
jgi:hypothetical protein